MKNLKFKPLLAVTTDGTNLTYPLMGSPKLDGIRALVKDGVLISRSLKPIPNKFLQKRFGNHAYEGCDGELIVGPMLAPDAYLKTTSAVMSEDDEPDATFYAFDAWSSKSDFKMRDMLVRHRVIILNFPHFLKIEQVKIKNEEELSSLEKLYLSQGAEGIILRNPVSFYKFGRSTLKEGALINKLGATARPSHN